MQKKEKEKERAAYLKIVELLSAQIKKNVYPPRARLPSMKELVRKFQVSESTVKIAFNMLKNKNFVRYHHGVGMIVREDLKFPLKLALIVREDCEHARELLLGMREALKEYIGTIEVMFYWNALEQDKCLARLEDEDFAGAVIRPDLSKHGYSSIRKIQSKKFPLVQIENFYQDSNAWNVDTGGVEAGKASVEHLKHLGRLPIGLVCPDDNFSEAFIQGYKETHLSLRLDCHRNNIRRLEANASPGEASLELMKLKNPPCSIIYTNPRDASAGYKVLKEAGRDLKSIKLVSFGEVPNNNLLEHPMFCIKRDFKELGQKATKLLIEQIKTPKEERSSGKTIKINLEAIV